MKIKSIIKEESIYDNVRYNQKTNQLMKGLRHGEISVDKKEYSTIVLLSLIYLSDLVDENKKNSSFVKAAISNAYAKVSESGK